VNRSHTQPRDSNLLADDYLAAGRWPQRPVRLAINVCLMLASCALLFECGYADSALHLRVDGDAEARGTLFGDANLSNVLEIHRRAMKLEPDARFDFLLDAVFPPGRVEVRIAVDFAPAAIDEGTAEAWGWRRAWGEVAGDRVSADDRWVRLGGHLIAPAVDLVRTAKTIGRIDEIQQALELRAESAEAKSVLAMRVLIAIAHDDLAKAREAMLKFYQLVSSEPGQEAERGPETVVMYRASSLPALRMAATELTSLVYEQVRTGSGPRTERWQRHVYALKYLLEWLSANAAGASRHELVARPRWHRVTRSTQQTNGLGYPMAQWTFRHGRAEHLAGHDRDYLYYDSPLRGDFTVEADVSSFDYRDTRLGFGGIWAGPGYDHQSLLRGRFAVDDPALEIVPRLDPVTAPMRVRLEVRDGTRTTLINGRKVFSAPVSQSDPWLSIAAVWYTHGWVENLRITGDVRIPSEIDLAANADLPGWNAYFDESLGGEGKDWRLVDAASFDDGLEKSLGGPHVLVGARHGVVAGSKRESLLRYHRRLVDDASVSYEFFYRDGELGMHPALGRDAYILNSSGIAVHRITDGRYERSDVRPDNLRRFSGMGRRSPPLVDNAWNRVTLSLVGDQVSIQLNGEVVFEGQLASSNDRSFGLFHYADATEARVRNLKLSGAWPKVLPEARQQQLADDKVQRKLAGQPLPATFTHDFADGISPEKFMVKGHDLDKNTQQLDDGIRLTRLGGEEHRQHTILPHIQAHGDFDIRANFEGFQVEIAEGGDGNIHLVVGFENGTDCLLYRKFSRFDKKQFGRQIIQAAMFRRKDGKTH